MWFVLLLGSLFCFNFLVWPLQYCFNYYSFYVKSCYLWESISPWLLVKLSCTLLGLLFLYANIRTNSSSVKYCIGVLIGIALPVYFTSERITIFMILSLINLLHFSIYEKCHDFLLKVLAQSLLEILYIPQVFWYYK